MTPEVAGPTALIVDDEPVARTVTRLALEHLAGMRVIEATSGAEALAAAARCQPDVVILDAIMPGMDGPDVFRALRANPRTSGLPVIVLTAATGTGELERLASLGALAVLSKALDPASLAAQVRATLTGPRDAGPRGTTGAAAPPPADVEIRTEVLHALRGLASETGGPLAVELVELLSSSAPGTLRRLRELGGAAAAPSSKEAARLAHTLKSAASMLGATAIARLAGSVESLASEGRAGEIGPLVDQIDRALQPTLARLRAACTGPAGSDTTHGSAEQASVP